MKLGRTGFGDLVPAMYPIPANPVMQAFYSERQAIAASRKGMGVFVPAAFNEPDNPVRKGVVNGASNALGDGSFDGPKQLARPMSNAILRAHATLKCAGPTSSGSVGGVNGLGDFDTTSLTNFMNSLTSSTCATPGTNCVSTGGVSNLLILGGLLVGVFVLSSSGGGGSRRRF